MKLQNLTAQVQQQYQSMASTLGTHTMAKTEEKNCLLLDTVTK